MPTALIFGASRGIGHEFVRQYLADGWRVLATCRKQTDSDLLTKMGAEPHLLDVTDADDSVKLASTLSSTTFDVIVINAGIFPEGDQDPAHLDEAAFLDGMRTNVLAPMRLAGLFGPLVKSGGVVGALSSGMSRIGALEQTNSLFYRTSKAALNMVAKSYSIDWKPRGVRMLALVPGWVRTDMGGAGASIDASTSVSGLRRVLAVQDINRSGRLFEYTGQELDW